MVNINALGVDLTDGTLRPLQPSDTLTDTAGAAITASLPSGIILSFGGASAPSGWLDCNGDEVSRTTYANLFTAIGTTWGVGDGVNTFNLPNLSRRALVGSGGSGSGVLGNTVGATGGAETHTLSISEMPAHNHSINDSGHGHSLSDGANVLARGNGAVAAGPFLQGNDGIAATSYSASSSTTGISINNNGSGNAHNIMQPSAVVMMIIKT